MLLIVLIVFQAAAASEPPEPIALKPPFLFHADSRILSGASTNGFPPVPPSATRLLTETFDSGFTPSVGVTGTTTTWRIFTDTGSVNYYWARVLPAVSTTYSDTVWAPFGGSGGGLNPNSDTYPPNMGTWLIYGPVNLSPYYAAEVTFNYLLDSNTAVDGSGSPDYFAVGTSSDGTHFSGLKWAGDLMSAGWQTGTFSLANYEGKSSVYVGFYFYSNGDANVGRGVFVDNVSLRAASYIKTFLPAAARNFSLATPTATLAPYVYNYTFEPRSDGSNPDFIAWGEAYSNGSPVIYEQGLIGGNPGNGMYLYNTQLNLVSMAGPNVTAPTNYEISVDFHVNKGKDNARYGIVFGAGSGTFGRGSQNRPTFNVNTNYYKFALQFPGASSNDPADYQLERCDGDGANCVDLITRRAIPSGANADGVWDTVTVRRSGSSIVLLINGVQINSFTDGTYTGDRKFGMFIQSANVNGAANPLEIYWDNYRVTQLP